jgi:hypothetical protein
VAALLAAALQHLHQQSGVWHAWARVDVLFGRCLGRQGQSAATQHAGGGRMQRLPAVLVTHVATGGRGHARPVAAGACALPAATTRAAPSVSRCCRAGARRWCHSTELPARRRVPARIKWHSPPVAGPRPAPPLRRSAPPGAALGAAHGLAAGCQDNQCAAALGGLGPQDGAAEGSACNSSTRGGAC